MFRKIAVALIATSMLVAPALAAKSTKSDTAKTAPAAAASTTAPKTDSAAPATIKATKVVKKHHTHRHHIVASRHRNHVTHVAMKPVKHHKATAMKVKPSKVVKSKKVPAPIAKNRAAAISKPASGAAAN